MPDIDTLMQEWPPEVEEVIQEHGIPSEDFECDLESYIDIACGNNCYLKKRNSEFNLCRD